MKFKQLIEENKLVPFVVTAKANVDHLDLDGTILPKGIELEIITPNYASQEFLNILNIVDGVSYGNKGLAMPKWVMYDAGIMPGFFAGFAQQNNAELSKKLGIDGYEGLVPVSMYGAIPTANEAWLGHTLSSIHRKIGIGTATKAMGISMIPKTAMHLIGVAQYNNPSIYIHTKMGDLELIAAQSIGHSEPEITFTYTHPIPGNAHLLSVAEGGEYHSHLSSFPFYIHDLEKIKELQQNIEKGAKYKIVTPGFLPNEKNRFILLHTEK